MDYFKRLLRLLQIEKEADRAASNELLENKSVAARRDAGMTWYPIAIRDTELGRADYLTVEIERTTHPEVIHNFRFGMTAALFSNHDPANNRAEGIISWVSGNRLKLTLRTDSLPDWSRDGKLGVDAVFDANSYTEMEAALKLAPALAEKGGPASLVKILTGEKAPVFHSGTFSKPHATLNSSQQAAIAKIVSANELAIVHGPPGTGKTTTLVQAIKTLIDLEHKRMLVTAPSNAAVDLLSEKLSDEGLNVVRIGNPARVNERLQLLTLDAKTAAHPGMKELKKAKKRAAEFRDLAHKYKRSFGPAEREQRAALFAEARAISKEVEKSEQDIVDDVLAKADVIAATLVGAAHYTIRHLKYDTVVIDEAGQALEPACWIPILKTRRLVMAGDHQQLPPTIKSAEAAKELSKTLLEGCVALHPEAVVLLEEQYRMHETIMRFSSAEFYGGRLQAHASVAKGLLFAGDEPLLFIDTAGCGFDENREATRISNSEEAAFAVKHLGQYAAVLKQFYAPEIFPLIGIISPYKHQVELLKERVTASPDLQEVAAAITVNTIDSFQGQERDVIYISLTRSNADSVIGFLSEVRRMNVAMTRARKKLVVIGDSATLSQFPFYDDFIRYAQEQNAYESAWAFMDL